MHAKGSRVQDPVWGTILPTRYHMSFCHSRERPADSTNSLRLTTVTHPRTFGQSLAVLTRPKPGPEPESALLDQGEARDMDTSLAGTGIHRRGRVGAPASACPLSWRSADGPGSRAPWRHASWRCGAAARPASTPGHVWWRTCRAVVTERATPCHSAGPAPRQAGEQSCQANFLT